MRLHSRRELALDALLVSPYLRAEGGVLKASVRIPGEADRARRQECDDRYGVRALSSAVLPATNSRIVSSHRPPKAE